MPATRPHSLLLCLIWLLMPAVGQADTVPQQAALPDQIEQLIGPRPDIDDYSNRDEFVRDILAWEKRREQVEAAWLSGQLSVDTPERSAGDWHHVTGPEDLDTALRNADGYEQPHYRETYRYNRTTHISFPLDPLAPDQMATRIVAPPEAIPGDPEGTTARQLAEQELVTVDEAGYLVLAPPPQPKSLSQTEPR